MYAIIKAGGKQYTVKPGDVLRVEKMDAALGAELALKDKDVLLVGGEKTFVGDNVVSALVTVVVTNQQRGPKLVVFKKKRRQGYRRMGGHRQPYTELFVKSITSPDGQTVKAEGQPNVFDPEKKALRMAKSEEVRLAWKEKARKAGDDTEASAKPAKKARPLAKKAKPSGAKKARSPKKAAAKSKTTKKTAKK